ncbi:MAG: hypothetical protein U0797_29040 [Gemmataceae bacterium]
MLTLLDRLHEQFPLMSTHDRQKLQSQHYVGDDTLVHAVVEGLIARGSAARRPAASWPGRLQAEAQPTCGS